MNSRAMIPTIAPGETLIVNYAAYVTAEPKRWEVIAFTRAAYPNQDWYLRVVALPGEVVSRTNGVIAVDGKTIIPPPWLTNVTYSASDPATQPGGLALPYTVPANSYFVLGDNPAVASDSRFWGAVAIGDVFGQVENK